MRGGNRPGAQDDLLPVQDEYLALALHLDAGCALAVEHDAPRHDVGSDGQVQSVAAGVEIRNRRAHAHAARVVERHGADPGGVGVVHVRIVREAGVPARLVERRLQGQPGFLRVPPHGDRAVGAVKVVPDVGVVFQPSEIRQRFLVAPLVVAGRRPPVEVLRGPTQQDLVIDGAAASGDLAASHVQQPFLSLRGLPDQRPVVRRSLFRSGLVHVVPQFVGQLVGTRVVGSGFQQEHRSAGVFRKPVGKNTTSGSGPDYDHVVFHAVASSRQVSMRYTRTAVSWSRFALSLGL